MGKAAISRSGRWFAPEPCRDSEASLTALALEARRRDLTYGQLVGLTTEYERCEIVQAYCRARKRR